MQLLERVAQHQADHNQQGTVRNGFAKLFVHVKDCFWFGMYYWNIVLQKGLTNFGHTGQQNPHADGVGLNWQCGGIFWQIAADRFHMMPIHRENLKVAWPVLLLRRLAIDVEHGVGLLLVRRSCAIPKFDGETIHLRH